MAPRGDEPTSIAVRIGEAFRGLIYGALGAWAFRYLLTRRAGEGGQAPGLVATALGFPYGRWVVVAAGMSIVCYALYQVYRALSGKFLNRLSFSGKTLTTRTWTERVDGLFEIATARFRVMRSG